jgi:hypothetical protein
MIIAIIYPSMRYVVRYIRASPSTVDVSSPKPDRSWGDPELFRYMLYFIGLSLALVIFIWTPAAKALAQSVDLWAIIPVSMAVFYTMAIYVELRDGLAGPLLRRGMDRPYSRTENPKWYWASIAIKAVTVGLSGLMFYAWEYWT